MKEEFTNSIAAVTEVEKGSSRVADFIELMKLRLSVSVVFSSLAGYLLGADTYNWWHFTFLFIGGIFVTGAANGFNQIIERDRDALMSRTMNRPMAARRMRIWDAMVFCTLLMIVGLGLLYSINPMSASFGALSIFLYTLVYTPLKARTSWAVFIGAIPGAIPFMLGWVAATNDFDIESGTLFAIQFIWQFPHFWAIAWLAYDDYKRAGYFLLPGKQKSKSALFLMVIYSLWLVFVSCLPAFGFTGELTLSYPAMYLVIAFGAYLIYKSIVLYRKEDNLSARGLMLASILFLTAIQIIFVVDKWIN